MVLRFPKVLFLDCETLSLDPEVASIRELAFIAEIEGKPVGDVQFHKVRPIIHSDDMKYGHIDIVEFCRGYNKNYHESDPDRITTFGFKKDTPLFVFSKSALTFNMNPPEIRNPADWLLDKDAISAKAALRHLESYIDQFKTEGRWVLAGHNIKYDYNVLSHWVKRLLGHDADSFLNKFNKYIFLDTLDLARWMQYGGKLGSTKASLTDVAQELGLSIDNMHSALTDVNICLKIATILLNKT